MKKSLLLLLLFPLFALAQVGIGTTSPDASSILDVTATDKGMLIPRVSIPNLSAAAPVTSPVVSLLVYNTNVTTGIGFYYWSGTVWVPFTATNYWTKVGNDIYNNNIANVGVGTTTPTAKFHVENVTAAPGLLNADFESNTIAPLAGTWATQSLVKYAGTYAAKSPITANNSTSSISSAAINIPAGGAIISFYYSVSSEANDYLKFYIDGVLQDQWSGITGWSSQSYALAAGSRTLRWDYTKDAATVAGADAAYIDNVAITTVAPAALRIVDGNQAAGKILVSDAIGNATWQQNISSDIAMIKGMTIPICNSVGVGTTGSFNTTIRGVNTAITWTIVGRQPSTAAFASPIRAERLQVQYDFNPALPFVPSGIVFTPYNNINAPDTFSINYYAKSQTSVTATITRTDILQNGGCWQGQFYFDMIIIN